MTPTSNSSPGQGGSSPGLAEAVVEHKKGLPIIWIIPLVTVLIGAWLWWSALQEQGPTIQISFLTADGLEAGKTKVKVKDLEVGHVSDITLATDMSGVLVTVEMRAGAEEFMVTGTSFWVVRPRIGAGGISGLGTLVSGAYINADLSREGAASKLFVGLEDPPIRSTSEEGLNIRLTADSLGSVSAGTPVYFMEIEVGQVERYVLHKAERKIDMDVFIEQGFADVVHENSVFWNISGITATLSADGFDVRANSLDSILTGGISFGVPPHEEPGALATNDSSFRLFDVQADAEEITNEARRTVLFFDEAIRGLTPGAAVDFRGIEVGVVTDVAVIADHRTGEALSQVIVETYRGRLAGPDPDPDELHSDRLARLIERGMRARLSSPNLLTGARFVEIVMLPDTPARLIGSDEHPEVPTVPSTGAGLSKMLDDLPSVVSSLRETTEGVAALVGSEQTRDALASVGAAAASLEVLMANVEQRSSPLLGSVDQALGDLRALMTDLNSMVDDIRQRTPALLSALQDTADSAADTMKAGEVGVTAFSDGLPELQYRIGRALDELSASMRSIAGLTDYLERHPEALLKGKEGE